MDEYKVKQIWPAHADHISYFKEKDLERMFLTEVVACQTKYDGERILMHFNNDEVYMTSRRQSKKNNYHYTEVQDNFPCFTKLRFYSTNLKSVYSIKATDNYNLSLGLPIGYTVLDGELIAEIPTSKGEMNDWSTIVGIIHSLPQRAIELQKNPNVKVKYCVFDCLFFDGIDLRDRPYVDRYNLANFLVNQLMLVSNNFRMVQNEFINSIEWLKEVRDEKIAMGYEGIVVKPMQRKYYDKGMYMKAKRFETVDLVVYAFDWGNGKYSNTVGALKVGYYDPSTDSIVHVTDVNCGTDKDRDEWRDGLQDGSRLNGVIEVKCQEITKNSLRHPVYVRYRQDKSYKDCTKETIFTEKE